MMRNHGRKQNNACLPFPTDLLCKKTRKKRKYRKIERLWGVWKKKEISKYKAVRRALGDAMPPKQKPEGEFNGEQLSAHLFRVFLFANKSSLSPFTLMLRNETQQ